MFRKVGEDSEYVLVAASQGLTSREPISSSLKALPQVSSLRVLTQALFSFRDQAGCPSTSWTPWPVWPVSLSLETCGPRHWPQLGPAACHHSHSRLVSELRVLLPSTEWGLLVFPYRSCAIEFTTHLIMIGSQLFSLFNERTAMCLTQLSCLISFPIYIWLVTMKTCVFVVFKCSQHTQNLELLELELSLCWDWC